VTHPVGRSPALRRVGAVLVWLAAVGPLPWLVWLAVSGGLGANPIESLEHRTGHYALRLLAASLAITPLRALTGWGWLVAHRRTLGLAAFVWAVVHLMVYVGLDLVLDLPLFLEDLVKRRYITIGMLAIALLTPLAVTSTKRWVRRLGGARWTRLHRLVYPAVVAALIHFLWAVKRDVTLPVLYIIGVTLLLGARVLLRRRARRVTPAAGQASSGQPVAASVPGVRGPA
jgi:sulfoxide reductase heme-binding subunit YedZ